MFARIRTMTRQIQLLEPVRAAGICCCLTLRLTGKNAEHFCPR